jgi:hypothetical protein
MTTTAALHNIAFALVRDAGNLMDSIDPGTTLLAEHDYGPLTIRARRVYTLQQDTLTLIAYHGDQLAATVIASNNGHRVTARIHQILIAGVLFKRSGDWGFVGILASRAAVAGSDSPPTAATAGASTSTANNPPCGRAWTRPPSASPTPTPRPVRRTAGRSRGARRVFRPPVGWGAGALGATGE